MPGKMLSLVSVAALVAAVAAHPYPECEPCAKVADAELEALSNSNKVCASCGACPTRRCIECPYTGGCLLGPTR